jgi:hypothetical protein
MKDATDTEAHENKHKGEKKENKHLKKEKHRCKYVIKSYAVSLRHYGLEREISQLSILSFL